MIAGIINFVVFVTLAHFLIMVHLALQIKDLYLEVLDELLNRINWSGSTHLVKPQFSGASEDCKINFM